MNCPVCNHPNPCSAEQDLDEPFDCAFCEYPLILHEYEHEDGSEILLEMSDSYEQDAMVPWIQNMWTIVNTLRMDVVDEYNHRNAGCGMSVTEHRPLQNLPPSSMVYLQGVLKIKPTDPRYRSKP